VEGLLIGRVRKFGVAFQANQLACLAVVGAANFIDHAAMGAWPRKLDAGYLSFNGSANGRLHGRLVVT
jgi:hypothetical protein